jgi:hypothetical protein
MDVICYIDAYRCVIAWKGGEYVSLVDVFNYTNNVTFHSDSWIRFAHLADSVDDYLVDETRFCGTLFMRPDYIGEGIRLDVADEHIHIIQGHHDIKLSFAEWNALKVAMNMIRDRFPYMQMW